MANNNYSIDKEIKSIITYLHDPLDFKYTEWFRNRHDVNDCIALSVGDAIPISDVSNGLEGIGRIILFWYILMKKMSSKCYWFRPIERYRSPSIILESFKQIWINEFGSGTLTEKSWKSYHVPKSVQGEKWAITEYESKLFKK